MDIDRPPVADPSAARQREPAPHGGAADEPARWPLPVRAAIAIGGGAGLWLLIVLALR